MAQKLYEVTAADAPPTVLTMPLRPTAEVLDRDDLDRMTMQIGQLLEIRRSLRESLRACNGTLASVEEERNAILGKLANGARLAD